MAEISKNNLLKYLVLLINQDWVVRALIRRAKVRAGILHFADFLLQKAAASWLIV